MTKTSHFAPWQVITKSKGANIGENYSLTLTGLARGRDKKASLIEQKVPQALESVTLLHQ